MCGRGSSVSKHSLWRDISRTDRVYSDTHTRIFPFSSPTVILFSLVRFTFSDCYLDSGLLALFVLCFQFLSLCEFLFLVTFSTTERT